MFWEAMIVFLFIHIDDDFYWESGRGLENMIELDFKSWKPLKDDIFMKGQHNLKNQMQINQLKKTRQCANEAQEKIFNTPNHQFHMYMWQNQIQFKNQLKIRGKECRNLNMSQAKKYQMRIMSILHSEGLGFAQSSGKGNKYLMLIPFVDKMKFLKMEKISVSFFQKQPPILSTYESFLLSHLNQDFRNYQPIYREPKPPQEKRQTRGKMNPLAKQISYNEEEDFQRGRNYQHSNVLQAEDLEENQPEQDDQFSIFNVQIGSILWKRQRGGTSQDEYLIKFEGRSYLHAEWMTEEELFENIKSPKNKIARFNKTFTKKLMEGKFDQQAIENEKYFDPAYLEVDRILTTTELFPVIHQKKANQIKGKWSESLMIVCSKLLNFTRNKIHYGVLFCEPVNPQRDNCPDYLQIIKQPIDLGTILNKVYLDIYKTSQEFWSDIGLVWKNCLKYNKEEHSDLRVLGQTLKECSIFLYDQWYNLCEERYKQLNEEFAYLREQEQKKEQDKMEIQQNDNKMEIEHNQGHEAQQDKIQIEQNKPIPDGVNNGEEKENQQIKPFQNINKIEEEVPDKPVQEPIQKPSEKYNGKSQKVRDEEQYQSWNEEENIQEKQEKQEQPEADDDSSNKIDVEEDHDDQRQYLNMDQFYAKNIFINDKKVQNPTTFKELELLNPGEFTYAWLDEEGGDGSQYLSHSYEYIDRLDMKRLDLNHEVDRLYMIKWKNLSYTQATWELQSDVSCPERVAQFKNVNKALGRESRTQLDSQRDKHLSIRDYELYKKKRWTTQQINEMKNKLYFYDIGNRKQPHQYKSDNIPVYKNYKLLRSYQLQSLNWLIKSWYQRRNIILADEMGLGKTIQSIAFLYHLFSVENVKGPFLIIAPLSTLEHWKRTVEEWTNMNCVLYYDQNGNNGRRSIQYYQWHHINITLKGQCQQSLLNKFQILITSYEVFMLDFHTVVLDIPFQFVIVDEAHRLKNKNAKILSALKQLPCKRVLLLTGTPIQNNTSELWSLLNYIHPEKFSCHEAFNREFGDLSKNQQVQKINRVLKPYMLRRMKQDVEQSIPPLQQTIIDVEMTNIQKTIYRALFQKNKMMLVKGITGSTVASYNTNLNNLQIQLRKCCNHPCLIKELQHDLLKQCSTTDDRIQKIVNASGKMVLVKMLLQKCKKEGKKVLIFSQFTHMLHLIEEFLKVKEYKYERIDGQIKAKERQAAIDRYNNPNKKRDVFLLSTKAGGVGINLTSANVVIIYDSDWNPQNDVQATARAHRIGQTSQVQVYRLVTSNTYETQMFERATQKLGLDKAIFIGGNFKETTERPTQNKISKQEMQTLLKKGILGFLENGQNQNFFDDNVENIIAKNSRIAKYSLINGSCQFSKSKFVSNQSDNQLKINDPNFWNIVLKNVESSTQILLRKFKNLTPADYKNIQVQKQLMLEAAQLTNNLIENKLSLAGFNADDEINLNQFLTLVNSQRQFHRYYRDLASSWLELILKPSRRFKKMTAQDLQIPFQKKGTQNKKSTRSQQEKDQGDIFVDSGNIQDQQEDQLSQQKPKITEQKKEELLKKLCFLCEQPKCKYHCSSFCKRAFHQECLKLVQQQNKINIEEITGKLKPSELCLDQQTLKEIAQASYVCNDCKSNVVLCYVCKTKGNYYGVEYQKTKKNKTGKVDEEKQITPKNKKKNQVTKCSTANCSKYYHPKCVEEYEGHKHFKYIDSNSLHFRCSLHYCDSCGISGDTMSILQCVRCPKALHIRCMDKQKVLKLSKKHFICDNHFKNKKQLKKTSERFNLNFIKKSAPKKVKSQKPIKQKKMKQQVQSSEGKSQGNHQSIIHHNYKTRRNRSNYNEDQIAKMRIVQDRKPVRIANKQKTITLTYQELGLTPINQFDYQSYEKDWCRYCGTRYSSNFTKGPWGSKTLCTVHYINWNNSKTLNLDAYKEKPRTPINPDSEQQLKFIMGYANKHPQIPKQQLLESLEKKHAKKTSLI